MTARILIVDDSLVVRAVVRDNLEEEGYAVVEAPDGREALALCRTHPPDVVLLDVEMPGLDGYQVLALLKEDPGLRDIPVVFLTSRTSTQDMVAGLRGGAQDYLRKPFETAELLARVGSAVQVKRLQDALRERNAALEAISRTDALTGLPNRRHLDEQLERQHRDALRHDEPYSVILIDIDRFKQINDTFGHQAGDHVLQQFAQRLELEVRDGDVGGRWGGEEFLVILRRTDLAGASAAAERIRASVADQAIVVVGRDLPVTVSAGCVVGPGVSVEALLHDVDACLYRAKESGRNRVVGGDSRSTQLS